MKIPKTITPCPIVEALIEIRFDSTLPEEAIFGIIYNTLKNDFPHFDKLPILQIPEAIRSTDQNLIYSPHYKLSVGNYILQIGPKVFSLANINEYCGWDVFYKEIKEVVKKIFDLKIVEKVIRMGLRYVNIFPGMNIYEKSNLMVNFNIDHLVKDINLRINLPAKDFINTLMMVSDAKVSISGKILQGSVIDIDTTLTEIKSDFFKKIEETISNAHLEEKKLFFGLLKEEYIKTLNPEY